MQSYTYTYNASGQAQIEPSAFSGTPPRYGWQPLSESSRAESVARIRRACRIDVEHDFLDWLASERTVQTDTIINHLDRMLTWAEHDRSSAIEELKKLAARHGDLSLDYAKETEDLAESLAEAHSELQAVEDTNRALTEANEYLNKKLAAVEADLSALRSLRYSHRLSPGRVVYDKISGGGPFVLIQPTSAVIETKPAKAGEKVSSPHEVVEDAWLVQTKRGDNIRLPAATLSSERPRGIVARMVSNRVMSSLAIGLMSAYAVYSALG